MLKRRLNLFTPWYQKSVEPIPWLAPKPGLYVFEARAHGFKGYIGGFHTWIGAKLLNGSWLVAEVTNPETLKTQGTHPLHVAREPIHPRDLTVIISERDGTQRWFGATPKIVSYFELDDVDMTTLLLQACNKYPLKDLPFRSLYRNCNTFTSWAVWMLKAESVNLKLSMLIGTRLSGFWVKASKASREA
jgi:hypothetical protein